MAAFYECEKCGREYLGPDTIPTDADGDGDLICDRCGSPYICGMCGDFFYPIVHESLEGVIFEGQADYCSPCNARECMPLDEEMALAEKDARLTP